ncbi:MAG TPA: CDP-alcohol phosphatidyltransferase family protein [Ignavibacteriales bacterium]|nr:CDP-alcohol phosphatidyltransferase family protein [Ignavibacteriales bacterium]
MTLNIKFKELFTPSNLLSLLRLFLSIPLWLSLDKIGESYNYRYITVLICLFAFVTDFLDGYLARRFNQITEMGKIIDPLADKVAMGVVVIKMYLLKELPEYYIFMILGRDLIIFLGGIFVTSKLGKVLPSNLLGKITVLSIGMVILLKLLLINKQMPGIYDFIYYTSIILIISSLIGYIIRGVESLRWRKNGVI